MRNTTRCIFAALALAASPTTRAETVEATSTTFLLSGQQARGGQSGTEPELADVSTAYEWITISARELRTPFADNLEVVVSTWGSYDLADLRWDNGTSSEVTGDVLTGYVRAQFLDRKLSVRAGRQHVGLGVARMIQIDGGDAVFRAGGVGLQAYAGSPVSQRFQSREGLQSWNPLGGNFAYGGRLSYTLSIPGVSGRGLDLGASAAIVQDDGDAVREDVGVDFRVQPIRAVNLTGYGVYSLYAERFAEGTVMVSGPIAQRLHVSADWRFTAPDLFLPRTSILSVFSAERRNDFGGGLDYEVTRDVSVGAEYHLLVEPGDDEDFYGNELVGRLHWSRGQRSAGAEAFWLDAFENGYVGARIFGRQDFGRLFAAVDVLGHLLREDVNNEDLAVSGTLSGGYEVGRGWSAVLAGRAGVNPFFEQQFDVLAKLVYNQTYTVREVR
jgi:hypothetical protein